MRPTVARTLLVFASVLCGVLLVEAVLRLRTAGVEGDLRDLHRIEPGAPWLYRGAPGAKARGPGEVSYALNDEGFRDRDRARSRRRAAGAWRVALLGDSVTFGYGVSAAERFGDRLERRLRADGLSGAEVMNFAVNGYSAYNEAELFAGIVSGYDADLVLVQFCVNDLNDPTLHYDAQTRRSLGALPESAFPDPATRGRVRAARRTWLSACPLLVCARLDPLLRGAVKPERDHEGLALAMSPRRRLDDGPEREWLRRHYGRIASGAAERGARFGVLLFPDRDQIEAGAPGVHGELLALAAREGWIAIDLVPAFRRAARESADPLFVDFWHPSARGHAVAATALADELAARGILP
ncbi:MAG: SGNH/GDSL hydrolase family protein [Myxococcota bacterium]|nr:SGNH/GDSL hydrolase family protein [Myxococcota bacterium]